LSFLDDESSLKLRRHLASNSFDSQQRSRSWDEREEDLFLEEEEEGVEEGVGEVRQGCQFQSLFVILGEGVEEVVVPEWTLGAPHEEGLPWELVGAP
jgi:hypothetical protein